MNRKILDGVSKCARLSTRNSCRYYPEAARLVQLMCRTYFGRKVLLNAGLRDAVMEALGSEDPKLKVICAGIAITVASDEDDTPVGVVYKFEQG